MPGNQRKTTMMLLQGAGRLGVVLAAAAAAQFAASAAELNDYPTAARADYVFACMKTNGETRPALEKCSCSFHRCPDGSEPCSNRLNRQEQRSTISSARRPKARCAASEHRGCAGG